MGAREGTTHTAIETQSTSGSLLPMYRAASCGWHLWLALPHHGQLTASLILESDDELEGARPGGRSRHAQTLEQERSAPKRYEKLYLVTVSKSKSGSWQTAKVRSCRRRTWRSCEGCRTSLESREDEKAKTRRSPWRVGAHERLKSNYDCDLVVDVLEDSISLQEVLTRAKLNG